MGLSIATLLSQHHQVTAVDIVPEKVELINNRKSPIQDDYIEKYLAEKELNLTATLDAKAAYADADFVVIAAPTNYDSHTQHFDTSAVEAVIKLVMEYNPNAIMVIKSTIPVGYTASVREKFDSKNIIFQLLCHQRIDSDAQNTLERLTGITWSEWKGIRDSYDRDQWIYEDDYIKDVLKNKNVTLPSL